MKKVLSLIIAIITVAVLAVPTFALDVAGANAGTITTTIAGVSSVKPTLDGKISEYEYQEIKYTADQMRYSGPDDAYIAEVQKLGFKIYAAYDANNVYVAVVVDTPDYIQEKAANQMYLQWSCQVSAAKGDESVAANRSEYGFAKNSKTNELLFNAWSDTYGAKYAPDLTGKSFVVVTDKNVTTYEMIIPAASFGATTLTKGSKIRLNICMNVGSDTAKRGQIEWSLGCGNGKDATKFAVATLGDAIVVPVKPTTPTTSTTTSAKTADATALVAGAMTLSLAVAYTVNKKSKKS